MRFDLTQTSLALLDGAYASQMLRRELTASTASEPGTSLELVGE
jgi:hypothetical protein